MKSLAKNVDLQVKKKKMIQIRKDRTRSNIQLILFLILLKKENLKEGAYKLKLN